MRRRERAARSSVSSGRDVHRAAAGELHHARRDVIELIAISRKGKPSTNDLDGES